MAYMDVKATFERNMLRVKTLVAKYPELSITEVGERLSLSRHQMSRISKRCGLTFPKQQTRGWGL
jgi:DNA-directed RNA polymerase specialized sigma subunit